MSVTRDDSLEKAQSALSRAVASIASTMQITPDKPTSSQPRDTANPQPDTVRNERQKADPKLIDVLNKVADSLKPKSFNHPSNLLPKTAPLPFPDKLPQTITSPRPPTYPQPQQVPSVVLPTTQQPQPITQPPKEKPTAPPIMEPSKWQELLATIRTLQKTGAVPESKQAMTWRDRIFGTQAKDGVTPEEKETQVKAARDRVAQVEEEMKKLPKKIERQEVKVAQAEDSYNNLPEGKHKERAKARLEKSKGRAN
jgi:hypothetical protein